MFFSGSTLQQQRLLVSNVTGRYRAGFAHTGLELHVPDQSGEGSVVVVDRGLEPGGGWEVVIGVFAEEEGVFLVEYSEDCWARCAVDEGQCGLRGGYADLGSCLGAWCC